MNALKNLSIALHEFKMQAITIRQSGQAWGEAPMTPAETQYAIQLVEQLAHHFNFDLVDRAAAQKQAILAHARVLESQATKSLAGLAQAVENLPITGADFLRK